MSLKRGNRPAVCCIPRSGSDDAASSPDDRRGRNACRYLGRAPDTPSMIARPGPHGRHAIADRDIHAGSVIVQCLPLAHSLLVPPGASMLGDEDDDGTRRRCARCFFQEGDEDPSGARKAKFGRCSKCRVAFYCSRSCQADDWAAQHKLECRYLVKRRKQSRHSGESLHASGPDEDATPLLLRTFCALKRMRGDTAVGLKEGTDAAERDGEEDGIVSCGPDHFASLAVSPEHQRTNDTAIDGTMALARDLMESFARGPNEENAHSTTEAAASTKVWGYETDSRDCTPDGAMRRTLDAFQKNNFGIVNALHSPIGEGVYPSAALLNHSCHPNCILRYKLGAISNEEGRYHPPILQIVACRDVLRGEEMCHSYVDLALCTMERRARLLATHGFVCDCARCQEGGCTVELPEIRGKWALYPLARELQSLSASGESQPYLAKVDLEFAMSACIGLGEAELKRITEQSQLLQRRASQYMLDGNTEGELQSLQQATELFTARDRGRWLSPFHTQLYSARCAYLSALLANGHIEPAVEQCEHIVSFLAVAFSHVENHPLLGLQLYTLGDLYKGLASMESESRSSWEEKSRLAHGWAKKVMLITHGADDPMVKTLEHNLSDTN